MNNTASDALFGAGAGAAIWTIGEVLFPEVGIPVALITGLVTGGAVGGGVGFVSDYVSNNPATSFAAVALIIGSLYLAHKYL
jgi:hypothetical protein